MRVRTTSLSRSAGLLQRVLDVADRLLRLRVHVAGADKLAVIAPGDCAGDVYRIAHADGAGRTR
jgi:hypothetical protein